MKYTNAEYVDKEAYMDFYNSWIESDEEIIPWSADLAGKTFEDWLEFTKTVKDPKTCPKELVAADTYFLFDETEKIVGAVNIRWGMNERLRMHGGNIGYGVRKDERRKGYAGELLKFAVRVWNESGMDEDIQIACSSENAASRRTIRSCGGTLSRVVDNDGAKKEIYIIARCRTVASTRPLP